MCVSTNGRDILRTMASHPLVLATAVQVRLFWTMNGVACINALSGIVAGGFVNSQAHANALGTAIIGRFTSSGLKALSAASTSMDGAGIRNLRVANEVEYVSTETPVVGTGSGDALPNQLAAVVTLRTAKAGRSFRGRVYLGGAIEAENTSVGRIATAYNTALASFMDGVQTDMGTEGITLAVLSRPRYDPVSDALVYPGAITAVTAIVTRDEQWDTMRSRKQ